MLLSRKELKVIKKDIQEQLKAGIETDSLYIKGFITYADSVYQGNDGKCHLDGRLTKSEIVDNCKVYKMGEVVITVHEDNEIEIGVYAQLIDKYENITDEYKVLSI